MTVRVTSLLDGQWIGGVANKWFEVRNPADAREVIAEIPAMEEPDVERAIESATRGARQWRRTSIVERGEVLRRAAHYVRQRQEVIAHDITREMGKLLSEASGEARKAADFLDYYSGFGRLPIGEVLPDARQGAQARTVREPRGIVVAITPWNDPIITPARKLSPALIAGNSVILKPAPESPLSALHLARALSDAGLPAGVLNVVTGADNAVSRHLVGAAGYQALTFTGSTEVGLELQRRLGGSNIALQCEMGGKNAVVVLADANLELVLDAVATGAFVQAGQRCTATSRIAVEASFYEQFVDRLASRARNIRVGPGFNAEAEMGPLVAERRLDAVVGTLNRWREAGGSIAAGGERLIEDGLDVGWFLAPTVVSGADESSEVWQEELFAPVVSVMPVDSLDQAIAAVNRSRYGLSASIFTRDLEAAHQFTADVEVGCVGVNLPTAGWDVHMPFGGFKQSGSPFKEQGPNALEFYARVKTIAMRTEGI